MDTHSPAFESDLLRGHSRFFSDLQSPQRQQIKALAPRVSPKTQTSKPKTQNLPRGAAARRTRFMIALPRPSSGTGSTKIFFTFN